MIEPLRPLRGGFVRPFGCGWFIRELLAGHGPHGSPAIDPAIGAPQADIFHQYKVALMRAAAFDQATKIEEKMARREKRAVNPDNIQRLAGNLFERMPYKAHGCRYHSFVVYFTMLRRLGWVEPTGREEPSSFQGNYPEGQPRKYYRLTDTGRRATESAWSNPQFALYGY